MNQKLPFAPIINGTIKRTIIFHSYMRTILSLDNSLLSSRDLQELNSFNINIVVRKSCATLLIKSKEKKQSSVWEFFTYFSWIWFLGPHKKREHLESCVEQCNKWDQIEIPTYIYRLYEKKNCRLTQNNLWH